MIVLDGGDIPNLRVLANNAGRALSRSTCQLMPNNSVAQFEAERLQQWVKIYVQRENFSVINIIADLPANRAVIFEHPHQLTEQRLKSCNIVLNVRAGLVVLPDVAGRRSHQKVRADTPSFSYGEEARCLVYFFLLLI